MGKPAPPAIRACPLCRREFPTSSLEAHMIKCAKKHQVKLDETYVNVDLNETFDGKKLHKLRKESLDRSKSTSYAKSSSRRGSIKKGSAAGVRAKVLNRHRRIAMSSSHSRSPSRERPSTANLKRPTVLDETLKDKLDMTMTRKQFLAAVRLVKEVASQQKGLSLMASSASAYRSHRKAPVGYRRDTSPTPEHTKVIRNRLRPEHLESLAAQHGGKKPSKIPTQVSGSSGTGSKGGSQVQRPTTSTLRRPVTKLTNLPHVQANASSRSTSKSRKGKKSKSASSKNGLASPNGLVPTPCQTCGRSDLPERFHTHPTSGKSNREKEAEKESSRIPVRSPPKKVNSLDVPEKSKKSNKSRSPSKERKPRSTSKSPSRATGRTRSKSPQPAAKKEAGASTKASKEAIGVYGSKAVTKKTNSRKGASQSSSSESETGGLRKQQSSDRSSPEDGDSDPVSSSSNVSGGSTGGIAADSKHSNNNKASTTMKCHICNGIFSKNSIKIHITACEKKKKLLDERKAKQEEEERKKANYFIETRDGTPNHDETFDAIWEAHVNQLVPCPGCGRTFFPDRIEAHTKSCPATKQPFEYRSGKFSSGPSSQSQYQGAALSKNGAAVSMSTSIADLKAKLDLDKKMLEEKAIKEETERQRKKRQEKALQEALIQASKDNSLQKMAEQSQNEAPREAEGVT